MYSGYVHLVDKKASGVDGGGSVLGAWRTRDLTDELADTEEICTLAANRFTLDAGTYRCLISSPAHRSEHHQIRLYNITDAAVELLGVQGWNENAADEALTHSFIFGRFTIVGQKTFEVQYQVTQTQAADGLGVASTWGDQIYTVVELWKEE